MCLSDFFDTSSGKPLSALSGQNANAIDDFTSEAAVMAEISKRAMTYGESNIMRNIFFGQLMSDDVWICEAKRGGFLKQDSVIAVKGGRIYLLDEAYCDDLALGDVDAQALFVHALMFVQQNKQRTYAKDNVREISRDWGKGLAPQVMSKSEEFDRRDPRQQAAIVAFAFYAKEILSKHRDVVQAGGVEGQLRATKDYLLSQLPECFSRFVNSVQMQTLTGSNSRDCGFNP